MTCTNPDLKEIGCKGCPYVTDGKSCEGILLPKPSETENIKVVSERVLNTFTKPLDGLKTGFNLLNEKIYGLCRGKLIVLGGDTGHGKSAFALSLLYNAYRLNKKPFHSLIISAEMSSEEVYQRLLSIDSQTPLTAIIKRNIKSYKNEIEDSQKRLNEFSIDFCDKAYCFEDCEREIKLVFEKCKQEKKDFRLIIIDYLQLFKDPDSRKMTYEILGNMTRTLKNISEIYGISIIALSQLNRKERSEYGKINNITINSFRESADIGNNADYGIVIYPNNPDDLESDTKTIPYTLQIVKNRNGLRGKSEIFFTRNITRFLLEEEPDEKPF